MHFSLLLDNNATHTKYWAIVVHSLRRWPNIKPSLDEHGCIFQICFFLPKTTQVNIHANIPMQGVFFWGVVLYTVMFFMWTYPFLSHGVNVEINAATNET